MAKTNASDSKESYKICLEKFQTYSKPLIGLGIVAVSSLLFTTTNVLGMILRKILAITIINFGQKYFNKNFISSFYILKKYYMYVTEIFFEFYSSERIESCQLFYDKLYKIFHYNDDVFPHYNASYRCRIPFSVW